tara:strand:+ start:2291 stop:3463 length:1173 start_codon:yes stop_codon:yes gene_type:complete
MKTMSDTLGTQESAVSGQQKPEEDNISKRPSAELKDALQLAGVAVSVAEEAVAKVERAAQSPDADPQSVEEAREMTDAALRRSQEALGEALIESGDFEKRQNIDMDELAEIAGRIHEEVKAKHEAERRVKEVKERDLAAKEKAKAERPPLTKEEQALEDRVRQSEFEDLNKKKARMLLKVRNSLSAEYYGMKTNMATLYMFPDMQGIRLLGDIDKEVPWLECYYGMVKESEYGEPTTRFRSVITADPKKGYTIENQAIRTFDSGLRGIFTDKWGSEAFSVKDNPMRDMPFVETSRYMRARLKEAENIHEKKFLGRLFKAVLLSGAIGAAAYYSGNADANEINDAVNNQKTEHTLVQDADKMPKPVELDSLYYEETQDSLPSAEAEGPDPL